MTTKDIEIVKALADPACRKIIFCIIGKAKTAKQIIEETMIPQSTTFKIMRLLSALDLIKTVKNTISKADGPKAKLYLSTILSADITISAEAPVLILVPNKDSCYYCGNKSQELKPLKGMPSCEDCRTPDRDD